MAKSPEVISITARHSKGTYSTALYLGVTHNGNRSDFDNVIVLAPGWLGSGTLHFAATTLAQHGHDVAVVDHGNTSVLHPNKDRSKHVHFASRAASQATSKRGVILIGHSNGNQDIHNAADEALRRQDTMSDDNSLYQIRAIGSLAGAGLSGRHINPHEAWLESIGIAREFMGHPIEELDVVARSVANLLRHPLLSAVEGIGAAHCDVRPHASRTIRSGSVRAYVETYLTEDNVIPLPDRTDYITMPGCHLTPIVCGDTILDMANRLYEPNNPESLQIAGFNQAA